MRVFIHVQICTFSFHRAADKVIFASKSVIPFHDASYWMIQVIFKNDFSSTTTTCIDLAIWPASNKFCHTITIQVISINWHCTVLWLKEQCCHSHNHSTFSTVHDNETGAVCLTEWVKVSEWKLWYWEERVSIPAIFYALNYTVLIDTISFCHHSLHKSSFNRQFQMWTVPANMLHKLLWITNKECWCTRQ